MYNASYLIRSRHAIFYFRYPIPTHQNKRFSMSLGTRCPKEALRLSKALEYHAYIIVNDPNVRCMDYIEIKEILRKHFSEVLERMKRTIDKDGALSDERLNNLKELQYYALQAIDDNCDELYGSLFTNDDEIPSDWQLNTTLEPIINKNNLSEDYTSREHTILRKQYKYALKAYIDEVLEYNRQIGTYNFDTNKVELKNKKGSINSSELKLQNVVNAYLNEHEGKTGDRGMKEKKSCNSYLIEVFGPDTLITDIDYSAARKVKHMLQQTPNNRSKKSETRDKPLVEQIEILKHIGLDAISDTTVNKYLSYISSMFEWAMKNKYVPDNPFKGMQVKVRKKDTRRNAFTTDEVRTILSALSGLQDGKAKDKTRFWGAMIAVYTGARLNEVAALTPDNIKQDAHGTWYFDITDDDESKRVKTDSARRIVPVHSKLLDAGLLDFVEHAKSVISNSPKKGEFETRLLYDLTYTKDGQWGRKLGRWFNETLLPDLGIKTDKKVLHSLRHSFITNLSIARVEGGDIKAMVGHEHGTVTEAQYTHYGVEHLPAFKEAIEKLPY